MLVLFQSQLSIAEVTLTIMIKKIFFVKEFSHVDMSDNSDWTLSRVDRPRYSLF